jgi:hypothetical protein
MLRASASQTGREVDTAAVVDDTRDPLVPGGDELRAFATALVRSTDREDPALRSARSALVDRLGPAAAARAATVTGNFEMMNRLLDASGVPVPARMRQVGRDLGVR